MWLYGLTSYVPLREFIMTSTSLVVSMLMCRTSSNNSAIHTHVLFVFVFLPCFVSPSFSLEAMDPPNLLTGQPGRSDPYLKLKLGKTKIDTRKDYIEDACEADLYQMHEFHTYLPGDSQLDIKVMDYDIFGGEE